MVLREPARPSRLPVESAWFTARYLAADSTRFPSSLRYEMTERQIPLEDLFHAITVEKRPADFNAAHAGNTATAYLVLVTHLYRMPSSPWRGVKHFYSTYMMIHR